MTFPKNKITYAKIPDDDDDDDEDDELFLWYGWPTKGL